jgi:hypothetical protein
MQYQDWTSQSGDSERSITLNAWSKSNITPSYLWRTSYIPFIAIRRHVILLPPQRQQWGGQERASDWSPMCPFCCPSCSTLDNKNTVSRAKTRRSLVATDKLQRHVLRPSSGYRQIDITWGAQFKTKSSSARIGHLCLPHSTGYKVKPFGVRRLTI